MAFHENALNKNHPNIAGSRNVIHLYEVMKVTWKFPNSLYNTPKAHKGILLEICQQKKAIVTLMIWSCNSIVLYDVKTLHQFRDGLS